MCGIAGVLDLRGRAVPPAVLEQMTRRLAHRGPDGEGVFVDGCLGLGHRRLAVIDLSPAGAQPMSSPDGRFVLSFNGEIYNYRELRGELVARGHRFRTATDTEVLLLAWAEWQEALLERLNGMFAFAIWDARERSLVLARDRFGVKPLYWSVRDGVFAFGSEVKAILAHPAFSAEVDREALLEYFTFQNYFTDRTMFRGVSLLPAGGWLRLSPEDASPPAPRRYWDYQFIEPDASCGPSDDELAEELDHLFRRAVERQLVSDVELGSYLSGGIDSGSITAVAARTFPWLKTFTCGFDLRSTSGLELAYDEREKAEYMSYLFRTEHYEMVLKSGDMERALPRLAWHLEEPRVGQSYPNFYAAGLAARFVKVCLSGTGGDELFGGYPWRYYRAVVNSSFEDYVDKYYRYWHRLVPNSALRRLFAPIRADVRHVWTRDIFRDVFARHASSLERPEDYVNHSLYFEARTFLHGLLVVEDKLSMAHGLETRVPFLDNDLVDFAMRLSVRRKLGNLGEVVRLNENEPGIKTQKFFERTRDGKMLLRRTLARYVPPEISEDVKQGFSAPDASWFKGDSIDYVRRELWDPKARIFEYLDAATAQELVGEHLDGRENRRLFIWSLLSFEWWLRTFA
jgi:asparagine synthase (glutamine-hydrolysing)